MNMTEPVTQLQIDQRVFDLYDEYCHGRIDRREFLARSGALVAGGLIMAQALLPRYAQAQTISFTDARIKAVAKMGSGYLYYVSLKGVTGAGHIDVSQVAAQLPKIRAVSKLPIGVGFGIRDATSAKAIAAVADAVVIGSRLVQEIESAPKEAPAKVQSFMAGIRAAMDAAE